MDLPAGGAGACADVSAVLVFATFPDMDTGKLIVRKLVEERLIACGNILPNVQSIYTWKGAVETSDEAIGILKTERDRYEALQTRLHELHPYEVPECIAVSVEAGLPEYLRWIADSVTPRGT